MPAARAILAVAAAVSLSACGEKDTRTVTKVRTVTAPTAPATTTTAPTAAAKPFRYQALWPFRTQAEAAAWQQSYRSGGHAPWHLDAGATAVAFARGFLGYRGIRRVVRTRIDDDGAHVGVGYRSPEGNRLAVAAIVHLARYGSGDDAPWEVVGTDDRPTFTLARPAYGADVASPLQVGGIITGVDESIVVEIRQPSSGRPLGRSCCLPAGGEDFPWQTRVTFSGASDPVLTISAATGGHVAEVERFAVTGVGNGSPPSLRHIE